MNFTKTLFVAMIFGIIVTGCDVLINPKVNMVVSHDNTQIESGYSVVDFGELAIGKTSTITFKIENTGKQTLFLNGNPAVEVSGVDSYHFSIISYPDKEIKSGESTTFKIMFSPTEPRYYTASISIPNNDRNHNPFTFTINGRGIIIDIQVWQNKTYIPNKTGVYNFGNLMLQENSGYIEFKILNVGSRKLELINYPSISVIGTYADMFQVIQPATAEFLKPGESTTFSVLFRVKKFGEVSAKISIENNDKDENPYTFTVKGTGIIETPDFDFNGDGISDVIIGTDDFDTYSTTNRNNVYIFFGSPEPETGVCARDADVKIEKVGERYQYVSTAGDFNKDGYDDVIVGTMNTAYVFFGSSNPEKVMNVNDAKARFIGDTEKDEVMSVSNAGDFNNDGLDDVIIGTSDAHYKITGAYVFFGTSKSSTFRKFSNADVQIHGIAYDYGFGYSVSNAGDFNGDGIDDIIVGSYLNEIRSTPGYALLFFGSANPPSVLYTNDADIRFNGSFPNDKLGKHVTYGGDFNGDGYDDIYLVNQWDGSDLDCSMLCVFFGKNNAPKVINFEDADVKIYLEDQFADFSTNIESAGDFNNDGYDDLLVKMGPIYINGIRLTCNYIYFGSKNPNPTPDYTDYDVRIMGQGSGSGRDFSNIGDFNADGITDVIVSGMSYASGIGTGGTFMFFGSKNPDNVLQTTQADVYYYGESSSQSFGADISGGK